MSAYTDVAEKCLEENIKLFANPDTDPEKYNLYNALRNLAIAIEKLEYEIQDMRTLIGNQGG